MVCLFMYSKKEYEKSKPVENVLAIDLGVRYISVTTNTANTRPNCYCRNLRRIRGGKYFNLRRKLASKMVFYKIVNLKNKEFLQVNYELHKISKEIVEEAKRTNAIIVVGKLINIRQKIKRIKASKSLRRLINSLLYYRLV